MVELVILLFVVLAVACFGLLLPFLRLAVGIVLLVVRLLASLARSMGAGRCLLASAPRDGSQDFYLSMMLDVPVPSIPVLRARLDSIRSGGAS